MKQESRTNINRVKKDISSPDSFTPPEELKRQLITTMQSIYDEEDIEAVERAYKVAYKAHEKQKRKSGEPYIIHPSRILPVSLPELLHRLKFQVWKILSPHNRYVR